MEAARNFTSPMKISYEDPGDVDQRLGNNGLAKTENGLFFRVDKIKFSGTSACVA